MVSIALATYNGEKYLKEQVDSLLAQTYKDIEIVACDDGSSDTTVKILQDYAAKDSRIKVFINEKNLGFAKNFEKIISNCRGEFIALCDQDDVWTEDHVECLVNSIGDNDLVCGNAFLTDSELNNSGIDLFSTTDCEFLPQKKEDWFFYFLHFGFFQGACTLFRKSLAETALPIPEGIKFHDYWLSLTAAYRNGVKYLPEKCLIYYRQHGNNITDNKKLSFADRIKIALKNDTVITKKEIQKNLLNGFIKRYPDSPEKKKVLRAASFFKRKGTLLRFIDIPYFFKNYKAMYLGRSKKRMLLRFVKFFIFGS